MNTLQTAIISVEGDSTVIKSKNGIDIIVLGDEVRQTSALIANLTQPQKEAFLTIKAVCQQLLDLVLPGVISSVLYNREIDGLFVINSEMDQRSKKTTELTEEDQAVVNQFKSLVETMKPDYKTIEIGRAHV